jgi:hypothetical protein
MGLLRALDKLNEPQKWDPNGKRDQYIVKKDGTIASFIEVCILSRFLILVLKAML